MDSILPLIQKTNVLALAAAAVAFVLAMQWQGNPAIVDRFVATEMMLRKPVALALMTAVTSVLFGIGVITPPQRVVQWAKHPVVRFMAIFMAGLTASGDIETAALGTLFILLLLQLARTEEERRRHPYMV